MKTVLMCYPRHFEVSYEINPWMSNQIGKVDNLLAIEQWSCLFESISKHAVVKLVESVKGLPDLVFTANGGFLYKNTAFLANYATEERRGEEPVFSSWFENQGHEVFQPTFSYEGEGDHLVDKFNRHWLGSGFRTDPRVYDQLKEKLKVKMHLLTLVNPNWYHLDTCFCPLPNGELLWYPQAFDNQSQVLIRESFRDTIEVSLNDAMLFACNCVCIGKQLFLPKNSSTTYQLQKRGYVVNEFDLSEFIKSGGAAKCLVLHLIN